MKFTFMVTRANKDREEVKAMSFKKCLKTLANKYPNETVMLSYTNKKGKDLNKVIVNGDKPV
tara:strand:- start:2961 stop:3146 length:186 start_codon:yes stop_codon:yes gene_type:complete